MSSSGTSQADLIALIVESRYDQMVGVKELEGLKSRQQAEAKEIKARQSEIGGRLNYCREVLAEFKEKISPHFETTQIAYVRAVEESAASAQPLSDAEVEAKKLSSQKSSLLDLIAKRDSARNQLRSLLDSGDQARREAWIRARSNNGPAMLWAIFGYLVIPALLGLISGGLFVLTLSFIVGATTTWINVYSIRARTSPSTYPARLLGRSMEAGDDVHVGGERFNIKFMVLFFIAPIVTVFLSLFTGGLN